jgi:hypothetical protein
LNHFGCRNQIISKTKIKLNSWTYLDLHLSSSSSTLNLISEIKKKIVKNHLERNRIGNNRTQEKPPKQDNDKIISLPRSLKA